MIGSDSTCAICHEVLNRPYTATWGQPLVSSSHLASYYDAPLHFDCLAGWTDREEFSREYFISDLIRYWSGYGTLLGATSDWLLGCGPADPGEDPHFLEVRLATWPFRLYSRWSEWNSYVNGGFRREMVGPPLDVANAVMSEVRQLAPSLEAAEALHAERSGHRVEERSLVEFGSYLATLWGESAFRWDWWSLEEQRRDERQEMADQLRFRDEEIARSNEIARSLVIELVIGGRLECPHCGCRTREMRFINPGPETQSYFVCRPCGRSFAGSESASPGF